MVVSTSCPVVFTCTERAPVRDTFGTAIETVPVRFAANPVEVTSRAPEPLETLTATRFTDAPVTPTRRTIEPAASTPRCTETVAPRLRLPTVSVAPASTRRYGPAGRSPTADAPVLTARLRGPVKARPVMAVVRLVTVSRPATPEAVTVTVRSPDMPAALRRLVAPSVMETVPPEAWMRVVVTPASVTRANSKVVNDTDCPARVSPTGDPVTLTYPALAVLRPRLRSPLKARPGSAMVRVPVSVAARVLAASSNVSVLVVPVPVKVASVAPPAVNTMLRLATATVKPLPVLVKVRSAVSCWPSTATVRPTPLNFRYEVVPVATSSGAVNVMATVPEPSAKSIVSATATWKVLTRTTNEPLTATPGKPVNATAPRASSA